jgi:tetratricopeptide (TPR) repeat protein
MDFRRAILASLALFVSVSAVYLPSARYDFLYDDHILIVRQNPPRSVAEVARVFAERHWPDLPYYRPIVRSTLVIQKGLHGNRAGPFHVFNAAAMGLAAVVLFLLLRSPAFGNRSVPAWLAAAAFGIHPIASECVYPISSGRESLMPTLFALAAVLLFARKGRASYVAALSMLAAALLSKESAIVVPVLFVLTDLFGISADGPGREPKRWTSRYAPVVAIVLAYLAVRWRLFGGGGEHRLGVASHPLDPFLSVLYTLQTTFAPYVELVYEPGSAAWTSAAHQFWLRQGVVAALLVLTGIGFAKSPGLVRRVIGFWGVWMVIAIAPTANLLQQQARFAERYGLLALAGVAGIGAAFASAAWDRPLGRRIVLGVSVVVLSICAAITVGRGPSYRDDGSFYAQWIRTDPGSVSAECGLGSVLLQRGQPDEAVLHFRRALEHKPDFVEALYGLGAALMAQGRLVEAAPPLLEALRLRPSSVEARFDYAKLLEAAGRPGDAESQYREALRIKPEFGDAHTNLGLLLASTQRAEEAVVHLERALALNPNSAEEQSNLALALMRVGRADEAIGHLRRAVALAPTLAIAHYNLGAALRARGFEDEATRELREAARLQPDLAGGTP